MRKFAIILEDGIFVDCLGDLLIADFIEVSFFCLMQDTHTVEGFMKEHFIAEILSQGLGITCTNTYICLRHFLVDELALQFFTVHPAEIIAAGTAAAENIAGCDKNNKHQADNNAQHNVGLPAVFLKITVEM